MDNIYELLFEPDLTDGVVSVSLVKDPAIQIEALQFSKEMSDEELKVASDFLISKGEVIERGWTLIESKRIDESFNFADIESDMNSVSEQDSTLFKIRYAYAPNKVNLKSRRFCKDIVGANQVYRKEDIEQASRQGVNGQFSPKGQSTYDIFLYKGGVNCKHFWERRIYLKDNTRINQEKALKMIYSLPTEDRDQFRFPKNSPKVAQSADASNNYWRLSSEEKRILVSPILIPDQKVFRQSVGKDGMPGYVFVTAKTIEELQQNFFKNNYNHNSSIEHLYPIEKGVYIFESWLIEDPENDKAKALGFDLPKGTWMVSMKIEDDVIWKEYIKTGKIGGLSMDAQLKSEKVEQKFNFKQEMKKDVLKAMLTKALVKRVSFNADVKEFVIGEGVSVFATELVEGAIVTDIDGNILPESTFEFEGKKYVTDLVGAIVLIEDVLVEELELSDEVLTEVLEEVKNEIVADYEKQIADLMAENAELKLKLADMEVKAEEAVEFSKQTPGSKGIKVVKGPKEVRKGVLGAL